MISELNARNLPGSGDGLGQRFRGVRFVKQHLALQVAGLDVIAVDDPKISDAGAGQQRREGGPGGAAAYDDHLRSGQTALPFGPDALEKDLAGITFVWKLLSCSELGLEIYYKAGTLSWAGDVAVSSPEVRVRHPADRDWLGEGRICGK